MIGLGVIVVLSPAYFGANFGKYQATAKIAAMKTTPPTFYDVWHGAKHFSYRPPKKLKDCFDNCEMQNNLPRRYTQFFSDGL